MAHRDLTPWKPRPASVVEAEVIIRDPAPTAATFAQTLRYTLIGGVIAVLFFELRRRLGLTVARYHTWTVGEHLAVLAVVVLLALWTTLVDRVLYPSSIRVGPRGLIVTHRRRTRRYTWSQVRWFSLRQEGANDEAYMSLNSEGWEPDAVKLPRFESCPPEELVARLSDKRRVYVTVAAPG